MAEYARKHTLTGEWRSYMVGNRHLIICCDREGNMVSDKKRDLDWIREGIFRVAQELGECPRAGWGHRMAWIWNKGSLQRVMLQAECVLSPS